MGLASSFYVLPGVTPSIGGIADNEIYKTITSGFDSYTGVAAPLFSTSTSSGGSAYYHGMLAFNFSNPAINWETNMSATSTTLFDLYTVALHELVHALGNASLINDLGTSKFGASYPYYSRYDSFLTNSVGTPLILPTSASCSLYDFIFNTTLSTAILAPGCTSGPSSGSLNNTVCADALFYTGSVTLPLYTPICFEPPSSLSHFEDQCYPTPGAPFGNDVYFVMSNAQGLGVLKRHLKTEERSVLCDLGYTVNTTYGSAAAFDSFINYGVGVCPGTPISGVNDGITASGTYAYLAAAGGAAIAINNVLTNDPGASTFECLEIISGGGSVSTTAGTTFNFTPPVSAGISLLRYIPVSAGGQRGNITYVLVFSTNATSCNPTACNLIANGDFVQHSAPPTSFSQITLACGWEDANAGTADYYNTTGTISFNIPCNVFSWEPDNIALDGYAGILHHDAGEEMIYTKLTSPLLPNTNYQLTLDVSLAESMSHYGFPLQVYFQNSFVPSTGMMGIPILDPTMLFTLPPVTDFDGWTPIVLNFTTGPVSGEDYIIIGDLQAMPALATGTGAAIGLHGCGYIGAYTATGSPGYSYLLIDNAVLQPAALSATFTPPVNICLNQVITLNDYVSIGGGTFTGPGVNCVAGVCTFDPVVAGVGLQTITYTYTNSLGCIYNIAAVINVVNSIFILTATASPTSICSGQSATLTATAGLSTYVWQPGAFGGNPYNVTPSTSTTYTVTAIDVNGCSGSTSVFVSVNTSGPAITVNSPTICSGQVAILTASGASAYSWSAGATSTGVSTASASPATTTSYTVTETSSGCSSTAVSTVTVNPSPTVTVNSVSICSGQTATLTASGASSYAWSAGATPTGVNTATATPLVTTSYTVTGTLGSCTGTAVSTVTVTPTPPAPTITSLSDPICTGSTNTLTSSSVSNWYNVASGGTALASSTTTFTTPTLTVTTTYYVSSVVGGCESARVAFTVNVVACCAPSPSGNILLPTYSSGITTISGAGVWVAAGLTTNIASGATLILDGINLTMSPNYKIVVAPGGKLVAKNGTNIWACTSYMWDGIEVQAISTVGGRVELSTNVRIEDAKIAVHIMNSTVQAEFDIRNTTFNKNHKAIVVDPFAGTHNGLVYACNFFSQNTPVALTPNVTAAFTSPYLKTPFAATPGRKSYKGIEVTSVTGITIGIPGTSGQQNVFDNVEIGIHSTLNTNLNSYNNRFMNIQYASCGFSCIIPSTGIAIVANNGGSLIVGGATNTANLFRNCYYGIRMNNNVSLDAQLNSFVSVGNNILTPGRCIYITNELNLPITIKNNTFRDFITGVELNIYTKCTVDISFNDFKKFDRGTGIYSLQNFTSSLTVKSNTFNNTGVDYGRTAIRVQNVGTLVNGTVMILSNDIRNCNIGIKNTKIKNVIVQQLNLIKFNLPVVPPSTLPLRYGIWNETCQDGFIKDNNVYKTASTATSAYSGYLYAYSFNNGCSGSTITDNIAARMNTGFQFAGLNNLLDNGFGCNFMNYNYTGLELNSNIGDQGVTFVRAQDNQWLLPSASTYLGTFGVFKWSTATTPVFYTRSAAYPWTLYQLLL